MEFPSKISKAFIKESHNTFYFSISEYILMNCNDYFDSFVSPLFLNSNLVLPLALHSLFYTQGLKKKKMGEESRRKGIKDPQKRIRGKLSQFPINSSPLCFPLPRSRMSSRCSSAHNLKVWIWFIK